MAVYRSPFSKPATSDTTPPNPFVPDKSKAVPVTGVVPTVGAGGIPDTKTSIYEEKQKLDNAYFTALGKIATSNVSEKTKEQLRRTVEVKYKQGGYTKPTDLRGETSRIVDGGIEEKIKGILGASTKVAFAPVKYALEGSQIVSRGVQSALKEVGDLTYQVFDAADTDRNPNGPKFRWSDFTRQTMDKDFKMINTGVKWVDATIDFVADVAFDPLTYAGIGAMNYVGKAGRMALTARLGTAEMLAKHPQLIGKLDDIMRYGVSAVPKSVRQAEEIKYGIRFAGQVIPRTEGIASVFSGNKSYSLATQVRARTGDLIERSKALTSLRTKMTPSSRVGLVVKNVGRNKGLSDNDVLQEVAHWTSTKYAKGFKSESYNKNMWGIKDTLKEIRKLSDTDQKMLYDLVENSSRAVPAHLKPIVDNYRVWQAELRDGVNSVYRRFNTDFSGSMRDIGFVDDFVHHRITDDAMRYIFSDRGVRSGYFKDSDMTMAEIGGSTGSAMYRKIRGPETLPDGTVVYSKFMGEEIKSSSVIKEVNEIFRRKTGLEADFFSTDLVHIADSYAYSMAAARGREGYFRRLMDYGADFSRVINTRTVPDKDLIASLQASHNSVLGIKKNLIKAVNRGRAAAGNKTEDIVKRVQTILDNKTAVMASNASDIAATERAIASLEVQLAEAVRLAATKGEAERGAFYDLHKTLVDEVAQIKAAIVNGEAVELAAVEQLRDIYVRMYPNAKRIPKSPTKLLDAINRGEGVTDTVAYRELQKRVNSLRSQLDNLPEVDADTLNEMLDIEKKLIAEIEGHEAISQVIVDADYAEDGLLYGVWDDLTERPFDPAYEGPSYRVLSTRPIIPGGPDLGVDEMAAARQAFMTDERSVAVHAFHPDNIHDMREPEQFYQFWETEGGIGEGIGLALDRAGLDGAVWNQAWDEVSIGELDEMFDEVYPELSEVMGFIGTMQASQHELGIVDDEFLAQGLDTFRELLQDVAAVNGIENSDLVAAQMMDDILGYMAEQSAAKPILIPSRVLYGMDNPMADGAYSLIVPENFSYAKQYAPDNLTGRTSSPVQFTKDNEFVRAIMDDDYHTAALNSSEKLSSVTEATLEAQNNNLQRQVLRDELSPAARQAGALRGAGTRRMKQAEKAWREWEESGTIRITVGGREQKVTRERALDILNKREAVLNSKIAAKEAQIARMQGNATVKIEDRLQAQRERLATLFNQKKVLERWDAKTGAYLRQEIDDFRTVIALEPPKGAPASETRLWSDLVLRRTESIKKLGGSRDHKALEAIFTQLHADEAQLAYYEAYQQVSEGLLNSAKAGDLFPRVVDDIIDGWTRIENMGIQMPPEMAEKLLPNVTKLRNRATQPPVLRMIQQYQNAFKIYATMSLGFGVRNAISATFMNFVDGVPVDEMGRGLKATIAFHKHGPNKWLDKLGITDAAERALYEQGFRAVHATGRGIADDFIAPTARGFGEKVMNNKATRAFSRVNSFVEDSVRLPMALDTLRNGGTYDDAVYRISRYHFDYSDLSEIDEGAKRYFIPFWVWTTRNIPLQMTSQLLRPSTYATYENFRQRHPVSEDILMPKWLQEIDPIGLGGNKVLALDLPQNRLASTAAGLVDPKRLIGQANPLLKIPIELLADKQLAMDIPFTDKFDEARGTDRLLASLSAVGGERFGRRNAEGVMEVNPRASYAVSSLLPPLAMAQRLTGGLLGGKNTYAERANTSRLSWLGIPIREVGQRQQRGEAINRQFQIAEMLQNLAQKGVIESGD